MAARIGATGAVTTGTTNNKNEDGKFELRLGAAAFRGGAIFFCGATAERR